MNLVFDSYALITFFRNDAGADKVLKRLRELTVHKDTLGYLSTVNVGEIFGAILRKKNERAATLVLQDLNSFPLRIVDADYELAIEAARLRSRYHLTVGEAYAVGLALQKEALLITGSPNIAALPESVGLNWEAL